MPSKAKLKTKTNTPGSLFAKNRGFLGLDEGLDRLKDRFLESLFTYNRSIHAQYLDLMISTPKLPEYLGAITLHDQYLSLMMADGDILSERVVSLGYQLGVRADLGYERIGLLSKEFITRGGGAGLSIRLKGYQISGVSYAVWRNKYYCVSTPVSQDTIEMNNQQSVEFAIASMQHKLTPVIQIKISNNSSHTQAESSQLLGRILEDFFTRLSIADIDPSQIVLQTNFITPGKHSNESKSPTEVAIATLEILKTNVPETIGGVVFVCDGLRPGFARVYLEEFKRMLKRSRWALLVSFNFTRGVHDATLGVWRAKVDQADDAQVSLLQNSRLDWMASASY
jgi:fructose-bisphosphate aldolase class 1